MEHINRIISTAALLSIVVIPALGGCASKPTAEVVRETVEVTRVVERVVTAAPLTAEQAPTPISPPSLSISVGSNDNILVIGMDDSLDVLVDTLQSAGFAVHTLDGILTPDVVSQYGVILFCNRADFGEGEVSLLRDWIQAGGGALFLHILWGSAHNPSGQGWREATNAVLTSVAGIRVDDSGIQDPGNEAGASRRFTKQIHAHAATDGVERIVFGDDDFSITSIRPDDPRVTILATGEEDAFNRYYDRKPPLAVAAEADQGRVIAVGCRTAFASDISMADNQRFALGVVEWLARRR